MKNLYKSLWKLVVFSIQICNFCQLLITNEFSRIRWKLFPYSLPSARDYVECGLVFQIFEQFSCDNIDPPILWYWVFNSVFISVCVFFNISISLQCFQIFNYLHHFIQLYIYIFLDTTQVLFFIYLQFNKIFKHVFL